MRRLRVLAIISGLVLLVTVTVMATVLPVSALPPDATVTIEVDPAFMVPAGDKYIVPEGGSFVAKLNITSVTDLSLATYRITYDSAVLSVADVTDGEIGGAVADISNVDDWTNPESEWYGWDDDVGSLTVIQGAYVAGEAGLTGEGYLVEIHFDVIGSWCDTSDIAFVAEDCAVYDYDEQAISIEWVDATVFAAIDEDVDGNGEVYVGDLQRLAQEWQDTGSAGWTRADIDKNGEVYVGDLQRLAQKWQQQCSPPL